MNTHTVPTVSNSPRASFRTLEEQEVGVAAAVATRAFFHDPLMQYLLPESELRFERLKAIFDRLLLYGVRNGEIHTFSGPVEAGAMWLGPINWHMSEEGLAEAGFDEGLAEILGEDTGERFDQYLGWLNEQHEKLAPPRHLYLTILAVDTHRQGRGLGSGLIRNMTVRADEEGLQCYLETQQPKNVALYQRHGFEVVQDVIEPVSGVRTWSFLREPK